MALPSRRSSCWRRSRCGRWFVTNKVYNAQTGRISTIKAGPGDSVHNLTQRVDAVTQTTDNLFYDGLNRLTEATTSNPSLPLNVTKTVTYNAIGNITTKSDVGAYTYDPARVHAVASIAPSGTGTVSASYSYDANGNMLEGRGRTVTWTSFDMVDEITQGANWVSFTYDSEHARLKQLSSDGSTKVYLNDPISGVMAELVDNVSTPDIWNNYIMLGGEMVALQVTGAVTQTRYFHKDHLGSIVALTDETGAVKERDSFDAWGQRRTPAGQDDPLYPGQSITSEITRGYTGHEQLDSVGLVHMNGRIYEPVIGKMMSADPTVSNNYDGQAYNRYAYVLNNPLSLTDPTGFVPDKEQRDKNGQQTRGGNGRDPIGGSRGGRAGATGGANDGTDADAGDITTGASSPKKPGDLQLAVCAPCAVPIVIGIGEIIKGVVGVVTIGVLTVLGGDEEQKEGTTTNQNPDTPADAGTTGDATATGDVTTATPGANDTGAASGTSTNPATNTTPEEKKLKAKEIRALNQQKNPPAPEDGTPGNNQAQNKAFNDATRGLTQDQKRQVHDEITGQNLGYNDIKAIADEIKKGN
jgi:RHS repeat-associated protein